MAQRWLLAQKYEQETWETDKERVLSREYIQSKETYAENIKAWFRNFIEIGDKSKILQVGAAGEGMIFFFDVGHRYAIDPLADYYVKNFGVIQDRRVLYVKGVGEVLPYKADSFDIVILFNVLDHVYSPRDVLSEIDRVLRTGGVVYIGVHIYLPIGCLYRVLKEKSKFKIDQGHPHSFTAAKIERMIKNHFNVVETDHDLDIIGYKNSKGWIKLKRYLAGKKMYRFIVHK